MQSLNVPSKPDIANSRRKFPTTLQLQSTGTTPALKEKWLPLFLTQLKIYQKWLLRPVILIQGPLLAHSDHEVQICQASIVRKAVFF